MKKSDIEKLRKETEEWLDLYSQLFDIIENLEKRYQETKSEIDKEILDGWLEEKKAYDRLIEEFNTFTNPLQKRVDDYIKVSKKIDISVESNEIYSDSIKEAYEDITNNLFLDDHIDAVTKLSAINSLMEKIENSDSDNKELVEQNGITRYIPNEYLDIYNDLINMKSSLLNPDQMDDNIFDEIDDFSLDDFDINEEEEIIEKDNKQEEKNNNIDFNIELYAKMVHFVLSQNIINVSIIQKQFNIDQKEAEYYIDLLEKDGYIEQKQDEKKSKNNERPILEDYHIGDDVFGSNNENLESEVLDENNNSLVDSEDLFADKDKAERSNDALTKLFDQGIDRIYINKEINPTKEYFEEDENGFELDEPNRKGIIGNIKNLTLSGLGIIKSLSKKAIKGIKNNTIGRIKRKRNYMRITNIEQPNNKNRLKKKILVSYGAVALAAITVGSIFAFKGCSNNKKEDSKKDAKGITIETLPKKTTTASKKVIKNNQNEPSETKTTNKTKTRTKVNKRFKSMLLGKHIKITTGSPIYTDAYSATSKTNGSNPYYSYNTSNEIVGTVLKSNDDIVSFVSPDNGHTYELRSNGKLMHLTKNEAINKVNELQNKGYYQTAVAVKNVNASYGVTGFYNVDSIGGKTR